MKSHVFEANSLGKAISSGCLQVQDALTKAMQSRHIPNIHSSSLRMFNIVDGERKGFYVQITPKDFNKKCLEINKIVYSQEMFDWHRSNKISGDRPFADLTLNSWHS